MAIDLQELASMSREEKLLLMDALWEEFSTEHAEFPIPQWQRDALDETRAALDSGEDPGMDWEDAKEELMRRRK